MKIRHRVISCISVLLFLGVLLVPLSAGAGTPSGGGFVFDEGSEAAAMKTETTYESMDAYLTHLEKVVAPLSTYMSEADNLYRGGEGIEAIRNALLQVLFAPADLPTLASLNTQNFRTMRSAAVNFLAASVAMFETLYVVVIPINISREWWHEDGSRLGYKGALDDMQHLKKQQGRLEYVMGESWFAVRRPQLPLSLRNYLLKNLVENEGFIALVDQRRLEIKPSVENVAWNIDNGLKRAEHLEGRLSREVEPMEESLKERMAAVNSVLRPYEATPSNTSDEARAVKIVCGALREFYSGYTKEYEKVREENEKYLRSEVYKVLSDNKDGLREPLKKTVNLAAELMLGLLSKPVVVQ